MRHRIAGYKLGRDTEHRRAMWRNMAASLFSHGQITTTVPKAKSVQPFVEKMITLAKKGDLASRRRVIAQLRDRIIVLNDEDDGVDRNRYGEVRGGPRLVKKLFDEVAPRYKDRAGGYTRIVRLGRHRIGDGAELCVLQLISEDDTGPNISGSYSRRREKANRRMAFAAERRKAAGGQAGVGAAAAAESGEPSDAAAETEAESTTSTATAEASEPVEQPAGDETAAESGGDETPKS